MASDDFFSSLDRVAAELPFGLHETDQVNAAFEDWLRDGNPARKRVVDLWTYCFVRRYVLIKFASDHSAPTADLEMVVERIYRKIDAKRQSIDDATRYAGWVSVVSKHTYLNYLRGSGRMVVFEVTEVPAVVTEPAEMAYDTAVLMDALHASIQRLPPYLREIAILRFVQDRTYADMRRQTKLPLPVIRSYVSKVLHRFRTDPILESVLKPREERWLKKRSG